MPPRAVIPPFPAHGKLCSGKAPSNWDCQLLRTPHRSRTNVLVLWPSEHSRRLPCHSHFVRLNMNRKKKKRQWICFMFLLPAATSASSSVCVCSSSVCVCMCGCVCVLEFDLLFRIYKCDWRFSRESRLLRCSPASKWTKKTLHYLYVGIFIFWRASQRPQVLTNTSACVRVCACNLPALQAALKIRNFPAFMGSTSGVMRRNFTILPSLKSYSFRSPKGMSHQMPFSAFYEIYPFKLFTSFQIDETDLDSCWKYGHLYWWTW